MTDSSGYRVFRPRRRHRVARWLLIGLLILIAGSCMLANRLRVIGQGEVKGEEFLVASLYPGRIVNIAVVCQQPVKAGEVLVTLTNPVRAHQQRARLIETGTDGRTRRLTRNQQMAARALRQSALDTSLPFARQLVENARIRDQAMDRVAAVAPRIRQRTRGRSELALAEAEVAKAIAERERIAIDQERIQTQIEEDARLLDKTTAILKELVNSSERTQLKAPYDATVVECPRRVGDIAEPGETLLKLLRRDKVRVLAWVTEGDIPRINIGMTAWVVPLDGSPTLAARVAIVPIELGPMPKTIQRYFWERESWQQFGRLELELTEPPPAGLPDQTHADVLIVVGQASDLLPPPLRPF